MQAGRLILWLARGILGLLRLTDKVIPANIRASIVYTALTRLGSNGFESLHSLDADEAFNCSFDRLKSTYVRENYGCSKFGNIHLLGKYLYR